MGKRTSITWLLRYYVARVATSLASIECDRFSYGDYTQPSEQFLPSLGLCTHQLEPGETTGILYVGIRRTDNTSYSGEQPVAVLSVASVRRLEARST